MGQQRLKNPSKKLSVVYIEIFRKKKLTYFWRTLYIYVHVYISIFSLSTWTFIKKNQIYIRLHYTSHSVVHERIFVKII